MNKLTKISVMALVLGVTYISSCKKDEDTTTTVVTKSKEENLTSGSWKLTAMTVSPGIPVGGTIITDFYAQLPACSKDNLRTYKTDGKLIDDEGATKCDPADAQTEQSTYLWNSDKTVITETDAKGDKTEYKLIELTGSILKVSNTDVIDGVTYTYTGTLTH